MVGCVCGGGDGVDDDDDDVANLAQIVVAFSVWTSA